MDDRIKQLLRDKNLSELREIKQEIERLIFINGGI